MDNQRYFEKVLAFAKMRGLKVCVEVGGIRDPSPSREISDGHSTVHFAKCFEKVYSFDIDPLVKPITEEVVDYASHVIVETKDGVEALREFEGKIDFLYLDAWDAFQPDSAEKHLEAFQAAEDKISENGLVLVDDVEFSNFGKAGLILPYALRKGWKVQQIGKQLLFSKDSL